MTSVRRSLALSFVEKYISLFISVVTVMVIARLLPPRETGLYSVAAGMVSIAQTLREFGASNYILQEKQLTRARLGAALWISVCLGGGLSLMFFAAGPSLAAAYGEPRLRGIVTVLSLNFVLVGFSGIGSARLKREMNFHALTVIGIASVVVHSVTSVVLAALGFGALGMAWASVLGVICGLVGNLMVQRDFVAPPGFAEWRRVAGFGVFAMASSILGEIGLRAPDLIVGRMLGFEMAGFYSRGNGLLNLCEQAFLGAVMPVSTAMLATRHREGDGLQTAFLTNVGYLTMVAWPLFAVMAVLAEPIFLVMFGPVWLPAVAVARPLCLAAAIGVVTRAATALLQAMGEMRLLTIFQCVSLPVRVVVLVCGAWFSVSAAAWGVVVAATLNAAMAIWLAERVLGGRIWPVARALLPSAAAVLATMALPLLLMLYVSQGAGRVGLFVHAGAVGLAAGAGWLGFVVVSGHGLRGEIAAIARSLGWGKGGTHGVAVPAALAGAEQDAQGVGEDFLSL